MRVAAFRYGNKQQVGDETGPVPARDGRLAETLGEPTSRLEDVLLRGDGMDELDELHHLGRVEEVEPDHARRTFRGDGHVDDRQRRGVGRKDGLLAEDPVEGLEDFLLQLEVLGHSLEDELAIAEVGEFGGGRDASEELIGLGLLHLAALDRPADAVLDALQPGGDGLVRYLVEDDVEPGLRTDLADAGTHGPAPHDSNLGDLYSHESSLFRFPRKRGAKRKRPPGPRFSPR